jgi:uncharacterized membrane protein YqaE (UPF0057 family)
MLYLLAIILPPVAVLFVDPDEFFFTLLLTILGYVPGLIYSFILIAKHLDQK